MTSRRYTEVGKLLFAENPGLAEQLNQRISHSGPKLTDLSLLPTLLERFCELRKIDISSMQSSDYNRQRFYHVQVFVAVTVKLYSPKTLIMVEAQLVRNLRKMLSKILQKNGERISLIVSDIKLYLTVYEDFAAEVDHYYNNILNEHKKN